MQTPLLKSTLVFFFAHPGRPPKGRTASRSPAFSRFPFATLRLISRDHIRGGFIWRRIRSRPIAILSRGQDQCWCVGCSLACDAGSKVDEVRNQNAFWLPLFHPLHQLTNVGIN